MVVKQSIVCGGLSEWIGKGSGYGRGWGVGWGLEKEGQGEGLWVMMRVVVILCEFLWINLVDVFLIVCSCPKY